MYVIIATMCTLLAIVSSAVAQPYDFSAADQLLAAELPGMNGHVAVIVRQNGVELYRFQAGDIGYDTQTRLASFTKTISAGVVLTLVDDGLVALDERLGDALPLFESSGLGDPTVLDAWAMRHGIQTDIAYEHDSRFTLAESVTRIGLLGYLVFEPPGSQLGYDGSGMQSVGRIAELRTGQSWETLARSRIFDPCSMLQADYEQFAPNPAIPGGLRSTAAETINFAQMVLDGGWFAGQRVLSDDAIGTFFTNNTRGLPVYGSPWPATHPLYPYGTDPDYAFGAWVLAENPTTQHVEEIVGAGAWGSFIWIDRRRGLTAVLITDVPAGSQSSLNAALGLMDIARREVEGAQVQLLSAVELGGQTVLQWQPSPGSLGTRVYGAEAPIRDVFDLRHAVPLGEFPGTSTSVPALAYYALTAVHDAVENTALTPGVNTLAAPVMHPDLNADGQINLSDFVILAAGLEGTAPPPDGDVDRNGQTDLHDFAIFQQACAAD